MKTWENFENDIANYLDDMLSDYNLKIMQYGNANSTIPDIEITLKNNGKSFFIETKMPSSQTSQFVVDINNNKFKYGENNKFKSNPFADDIIEILNNNFEMYKNVGQNGFVVPVPDTIAFGWIVSNMKNKNVEFIVSVDSSNNERIIPVESFGEFFNAKTILRRKKSGSSSLPKKYYDDFNNELQKRFSTYELFSKKSKLYVKLDSALTKSQCYLDSGILKDKKYFLSEKENNFYEVKITSATNNPNIIFELSLKDNVDKDLFTIQAIIDYLNNYDN